MKRNMMVLPDPGTVWWENIAGPSSLIADIEEALTEGHGVICDISSTLSYRWSFRGIVDHWASEMEMSVEQVECEDYQDGDIEAFLVEHLCPSAYTDYQRKKSPQYLKSNGLLNGKLIWIRGVPSRYYRKWIQYISSYRSTDTLHGLFFMEVIDTAHPAPKSMQNLQFLAVKDAITRADLKLFTSIMTEYFLDLPDNVKQYVVELITSLCQTDAELACRLIELPQWYEGEPCQALSELYEAEYRDSPRGKESWHPFSLIRQGKCTNLSNRVWTAQIRVGYPRIELERQQFIEQHYEELAECLTHTYLDPNDGRERYLCDYEKSRITDPHDLEIGMVCRLMHLNRADGECRMLYVPDPDLRDRLYLLRDCRNHLAHMDLCPSVDFIRLLAPSECD